MMILLHSTVQQSLWKKPSLDFSWHGENKNVLSFIYILGNVLTDSKNFKKSIIKTARGKQLLWELLGKIVKFWLS